MRKKLLCITVLSCLLLSGCTQAEQAKRYGGSMTINLPENQKLESITWKENNLWYLTRPMTDNDIAETHTFQEDSNYGVFEGTITIVESKSE